MHNGKARRSAGAVLTLAAAAAIAGCSDTTAPELSTLVSGPEFAVTLPDQLFGQKLYVCKDGSDASFSVVANGADAGTVDVSDGDCIIGYQWDGQMFDTVTVTVTEIAQDGYELEHIEQQEILCSAFDTCELGDVVEIDGTSSVTSVIGGRQGSVVVFVNVEKEKGKKKKKKKKKGKRKSKWWEDHDCFKKFKKKSSSPWWWWWW
jgi:hypothetical protein